MIGISAISRSQISSKKRSPVLVTSSRKARRKARIFSDISGRRQRKLGEMNSGLHECTSPLCPSCCLSWCSTRVHRLSFAYPSACDGVSQSIVPSLIDRVIARFNARGRGYCRFSSVAAGRIDRKRFLFPEIYVTDKPDYMENYSTTTTFACGQARIPMSSSRTSSDLSPNIRGGSCSLPLVGYGDMKWLWLLGRRGGLPIFGLEITMSDEVRQELALSFVAVPSKGCFEDIVIIHGILHIAIPTTLRFGYC